MSQVQKKKVVSASPAGVGWRWIPLVFAGVLAALSVFLIVQAATCEVGNYAFPWIAEGGVFADNNIHVGPLQLYWVLVLTGFVFTVAASLARRLSYGFNVLGAVVIPALFLVESLLGAKILFAIEKIISNRSFAEINFSGQSLFGSLYLTVPLFWLLTRIFRDSCRKLCDFVAPFWLILLAFTRLGCFTSGCCGSQPFHLNGHLVLYPVQLWDALCALVLLWVCLKAESRPDHSWHGWRPFPILLVGYSACRFVLELIRTNEPLFYKLTISQYHCLLFIVLGILMMLRDNGRLRKKR